MTRNMKIKFCGEINLNEFIKVTFRAKNTQIPYIGKRWRIPLVLFSMKFARIYLYHLTALLCVFAIQVFLNV